MVGSPPPIPPGTALTVVGAATPVGRTIEGIGTTSRISVPEPSGSVIHRAAIPRNLQPVLSIPSPSMVGVTP